MSMFLDRLHDAQTTNERVFLRDMRGSVTFAEFRDAVQRIADVLADAGARPDERVGVLTNNSIESVICLFGIAQYGCIFVPINYRNSEQSIRHITDDCGIERMFSFSNLAFSRAAEWGVQAVPVSNRRAYLWQRQIDPGSDRASSGEKISALFYTSGSTGSAKGVMLTADNLERSARSVAEYMALTPADVLLCVLPVSFDAGFSQITSALVSGAEVVLLNYMLPNDVARTAERHAVTVLIAVPPLLARINDAKWDTSACRRIRLVASTGGDLSNGLLHELRDRFPAAQVLPMYGLTEAFRGTYLPPQDLQRKAGSVGLPIPDAEILVLRDDGTRCAANEVGEIVQCGPLVSQGYWGKSDAVPGAYARFAPAPEFSRYAEGRCVYSGDLGYLDEEGYLFFVGRRDGMIKIDGHRISPLRIENAVMDHPKVEECVVVVDTWSEPHHKSIIALVVASTDHLRELEADLQQQLRALFMHAAQRPQRYKFFDSLPRDLNGKISRTACIELVKPA